jgi:hypothetical protein
MISGVLNPNLNVRFMNLRFTISKSIDLSLKSLVLVIFLLSAGITFAQSDTIRYDITLSGLAATGEYAPFWLQNRQYGKTSIQPLSTGLLVGISKDFNPQKRIFDYAFKASGLLRSDKLHTEYYFHEYYAKARLFVFDFVAGAREEQLGNQDSTLSGGGLLFSQNARPMPKLTIGIEHFTPVPFTHGYLEIKGALSHGWFTDNTYATGMLLHHKYVYLRVGGKLPVHLQYGLDHVAQWGGNVPGLGVQPTGISDYLAVFKGGHGGADANLGDQINALGNHIFSQSLRLDIDMSGFKLGAYWQNISEDGPIRFIGNTMNTPDGLWGISLRNTSFPFVKGILYEYLNTTDQSGPFHDKDGIVYGGADGYFYNFIYKSGWTYFSRTLGTPFITSPLYNSNGSLSIQNNRLQVHHFGLEGTVCDYQYRLLTSFSKNYGFSANPITVMKPQTSVLLDINKTFPRLANVEVSCAIGADFGQLIGNSVGIQLSVRKRGDLLWKRK